MLIKAIIKIVTHGYYNEDKIMDNTFLISLNLHLSTRWKISVILIIKITQEKTNIFERFKKIIAVPHVFTRGYL